MSDFVLLRNDGELSCLQVFSRTPRVACLFVAMGNLFRVTHEDSVVRRRQCGHAAMLSGSFQGEVFCVRSHLYIAEVQMPFRILSIDWQSGCELTKGER